MERRKKRSQSSTRSGTNFKNMVYATISGTGVQQVTPVSVVREEQNENLRKIQLFLMQILSCFLQFTYRYFRHNLQLKSNETSLNCYFIKQTRPF